MGMARMHPIVIPIEITVPTSAPVSCLNYSLTVPGAAIAHSVEKYPLLIANKRAFVILSTSVSKKPLLANIMGINVKKKIILK
jgi:hypothetical protein